MAIHYQHRLWVLMLSGYKGLATNIMVNVTENRDVKLYRIYICIKLLSGELFSYAYIDINSHNKSSQESRKCHYRKHSYLNDNLKSNNLKESSSVCHIDHIRDSWKT